MSASRSRGSTKVRCKQDFHNIRSSAIPAPAGSYLSDIPDVSSVGANVRFPQHFSHRASDPCRPLADAPSDRNLSTRPSRRSLSHPYRHLFCPDI